MVHELQHPYISVQKESLCSFGGNQAWLSRSDLRTCGCGAVAMADFLTYISRYHGFEPLPEASDTPIPLSQYDKLVSRLQLHYLPMVPPFGITGVGLAGGLGLYCKLHAIPLTPFWGVRRKNFWHAMAEMLDRDLPVIFAVGPNFPFVWQQYRLNLYHRCGDTYLATSRVKGHFLTATGLDETWIKVSSWGKEFYIHRGEYAQYGQTHSLAMAHNLLWIP